MCWPRGWRCGFAWQPLDHDKKDKPQPARKVASVRRLALACTVIPLVGVLRVVLVLFIFAFGLSVIPAILRRSTSSSASSPPIRRSRSG
jgi:hypothetical protein